VRRLSAQTRDTTRRGSGNKARRRAVAARAASASSSHVRGLSRSNAVKSKAQQRLLYARGYTYAHSAAKRGGAYKALPDRVKPRT
jgi:hypothetical protein